MPKPLEDILTYKHEVMDKLKKSQNLIGLLANDPDIDMDSDDAYAIQDGNFYDYSYADETFQEDKAVVFVEVYVNRRPSVEFKGLQIQIQVLCNKAYCELDGKIFRGVLGNRRDNIACEIANALEGSGDFGVGDLLLTDAHPITPPNGFTGYGMTFTAVDFAIKDDYDDA